jgi:Ser/Thr protein kinase RdoA (MazF antagonist)/MoaA/NifB/PqqE/SkfB family radical SAM enzyme/LmbE family N-acetylglucosaminyl deacetylase
MKNKMFIKIISFFLLITFTATNVSWSMPVSTLIPSQVMPAKHFIEDIKIDPQFGKIDGLHIGDSDVTVALIQDAHCNYEAQLNESEIIKTLVEDHGFEAIYLEGAVGQVDTSIFTAYPHKEVKEKVFKEALKNGEINGADYYSIMRSDGKLTWMHGVEDEDLYERNFKAAREIISRKESFSTALHVLIEQFKKLKNLSYSNALLELDSLISVSLESAVAEGEASNYCMLLSKLLQYAEKYDLDCSNYPEINRVRQNIASNGDLADANIEQLISDVSSFSRNLKSMIIRNKNEEEIDKQWQKLILLDKGMNLSLTRQAMIDLNELRDVSFSDIVGSLQSVGLLGNIDSSMPDLERGQANIENFYELVVRRDSVMIDNLIEQTGLNNHTKVILVTGGFHSQAVHNHFYANKTSFISLSPKIDPDYDVLGGNASYLKNLQKRIPFTNLTYNGVHEVSKNLENNVFQKIVKEEQCSEYSFNKYASTMMLRNAFENNQAVDGLFYSLYAEHLQEVGVISRLGFANLIAAELRKIDFNTEDGRYHATQKIYSISAALDGEDAEGVVAFKFPLNIKDIKKTATFARYLIGAELYSGAIIKKLRSAGWRNNYEIPEHEIQILGLLLYVGYLFDHNEKPVAGIIAGLSNSLSDEQREFASFLKELSENNGFDAESISLCCKYIDKKRNTYHDVNGLDQEAFMPYSSSKKSFNGSYYILESETLFPTILDFYQAIRSGQINTTSIQSVSDYMCKAKEEYVAKEAKILKLEIGLLERAYHDLKAGNRQIACSSQIVRSLTFIEPNMQYLNERDCEKIIEILLNSATLMNDGDWLHSRDYFVQRVLNFIQKTPLSNVCTFTLSVGGTYEKRYKVPKGVIHKDLLEKAIAKEFSYMVLSRAAFIGCDMYEAKSDDGNVFTHFLKKELSKYIANEGFKCVIDLNGRKEEYLLDLNVYKQIVREKVDLYLSARKRAILNGEEFWYEEHNDRRTAVLPQGFKATVRYIHMPTYEEKKHANRVFEHARKDKTPIYYNDILDLPFVQGERKCMGCFTDFAYDTSVDRYPIELGLFGFLVYKPNQYADDHFVMTTIAHFAEGVDIEMLENMIVLIRAMNLNSDGKVFNLHYSSTVASLPQHNHVQLYSENLPILSNDSVPVQNLDGATIEQVVGYPAVAFKVTGDQIRNVVMVARKISDSIKALTANYERESQFDVQFIADENQICLIPRIRNRSWSFSFSDDMESRHEEDRAEAICGMEAAGYLMRRDRHLFDEHGYTGDEMHRMYKETLVSYDYLSDVLYDASGNDDWLIKLTRSMRVNAMTLPKESVGALFSEGADSDVFLSTYKRLYEEHVLKVGETSEFEFKNLLVDALSSHSELEDHVVADFARRIYAIDLSNDEKGYWRKPAAILDLEYGQKMFDTVSHGVAVCVIGTSIEHVLEAIRKLNKDRGTLKPHHSIVTVVVAVADNDLWANKKEIEDALKKYNFNGELIAFQDRSVSVLTKIMQSKAIENSATIVMLLNDFATYPKNYVSKTIHRLVNCKKPSVLISPIAGHTKEDVLNSPLDLSFYVDAFFIEDQDPTTSWFEYVSKYFVVNGDDLCLNATIQANLKDEFLKGFGRDIKSTLYQTYNLESVGGFAVDIDGETLPRNERLLFVEPHQDDYVLSSATLIKRLLSRGNRVFMLTLLADSSDDYLPVLEEVRIDENKAAFDYLEAQVDSGLFRFHIRPLVKILGGSKKEQRVQAISNISTAISDFKPSIVVLPAVQDNHRQHVRLNSIGMHGIQHYVDLRKESIQVWTVPLLSAEPVAYSNMHHFIRQTEKDLKDKRMALDLYLSQVSIVRGETFDKRCKDVNEIVSARVRESGLNTFTEVDSIDRKYECFQEYVIEPIEEFQSSEFKIANLDSKKFRIECTINKTTYYVDYSKEGKSVQISAVGTDDYLRREVSFDDLYVLEKRLLELLNKLDDKRDFLFERSVNVNDSELYVLDWLVNELREKKSANQVYYSAKRQTITALQVLWEQIVSQGEELRLMSGEITQKGEKDLLSEKLYESRIREKHKIVIGIPIFDGADIIAERLLDIRKELKLLPKEMQHLNFDIVLCVNSSKAALEKMVSETIQQIPDSFFDGLPVTAKIIVRKQPFPSQTNAMTDIQKYSEKVNASILMLTDDDVRYDDYAIANLMKGILSVKDKRTMVGAHYYWRRRSVGTIFKEAVVDLNNVAIMRHFPSFVIKSMAAFIVPFRLLFQESAIFPRRPDLPNSRNGICGAGITLWTEAYIGVPYWIRQSDVLLRYRYKPNIFTLRNARFSGLAARSLSFALKARTRTFFGYKGDIFRMFSKERVEAQQNPYDVYYRKGMRGILKSLSLTDQLAGFASFAFYYFSNWLYSNFGEFFLSSRLSWIRTDTGEEKNPLTKDLCRFSAEFIDGLPFWDQMEIAPRKVVLDGKLHSGKDFSIMFLDMMKHIDVSELGLPLLSDNDVDLLKESYLQESEVSEDVSVDALIRVFSALYAVPDIYADQIMEESGLSVDELRMIFLEIKQSKLLQSVFGKHPTLLGYFLRLKKILSKQGYCEKLVKGEFVFPDAMEMHPSTYCNFKCNFCYSLNNWSYQEQANGDKPLSVNEWMNIIEEAKDSGLEELFVSGGLEPMAPTGKTLKILRKALDVGIETIWLFTNGTYLNESNDEMVDTLLSIDNLAISLKGISKDTYEEVADYSDFDGIVQNIKGFVKEKEKRGAKTTILLAFFLNAETYRELPLLMDLIKENHLESVEIGLSTDNISTRPDVFDEDDRRRIVEMLKDVMKSGVKYHFNPELWRLLSQEEFQDSQLYKYRLQEPTTCQYWFSRPALNPYGNLHACCFVSQPGIAPKVSHAKIGTVTEDNSIEDVLLQMEGKKLSVKDCPSCNPAEKTGLRVIEKLKHDYVVGISPEFQPYIQDAKFKEAEDKAQSIIDRVLVNNPSFKRESMIASYLVRIKDELSNAYLLGTFHELFSARYPNGIRLNNRYDEIRDLVMQEASLFHSSIPVLHNDTVVSQKVDPIIPYASEHEFQMARERYIVERTKVIDQQMHYWNSLENKFCVSYEVFNIQDQQPTVSIVIPTIQGRFDNIKRRIQNVARMGDTQHAEIVIVVQDYNSYPAYQKSELQNIMHELGVQGRIIGVENNVSIAVNRNIGTLFAKGEFIVFADDDVEFNGSSISRLVDILKQKEEVGVASVASYEYNPVIKGKALLKPRVTNLKYQLEDELYTTNTIYGLIMATRKDIARSVPFVSFWPNMGEDVMFVSQVHNLGFTSVYDVSQEASVVHEDVAYRETNRNEKALRNGIVENMLAYYIDSTSFDKIRNDKTIMWFKSFSSGSYDISIISEFWELLQDVLNKDVFSSDECEEMIKTFDNTFVADHKDLIISAISYMRSNIDEIRNYKTMYYETKYIKGNSYHGGIEVSGDYIFQENDRGKLKRSKSSNRFLLDAVSVSVDGVISSAAEAFQFGRINNIDHLDGGAGKLSEQIPVLDTEKYGKVLLKRIKVETQQEAEYVAGFISSLRRSGLPVGVIENPTKAGNTENVMFEYDNNDGKKEWYIVEKWVDGRNVSRVNATPEILRQMGKMLAQIHNATQNYALIAPRDINNHSIAGMLKMIWQDRKDLDNRIGLFGDNMQQGIRDIFGWDKMQEIVNYIESSNARPIIEDFNIANVLWDEKRDDIRLLFDFDQATKGTILDDFLPTLIHTGRPGEGLHLENLKEDLFRILEGYQSNATMQLTKDEIDMLPFFFVAKVVSVIPWALLEMQKDEQSIDRMERYINSKVEIVSVIRDQFKQYLLENRSLFEDFDIYEYREQNNDHVDLSLIVGSAIRSISMRSKGGDGISLAIYSQTMTNELLNSIKSFSNINDDISLFVKKGTEIPASLSKELREIPNVRIEPAYSKEKYGIDLSFSDVVNGMSGATKDVRVIAPRNILEQLNKRFDPEARPIMFLPIDKNEQYTKDAELGLLMYAFMDKDKLMQAEGGLIKKVIHPNGVVAFQFNIDKFPNLDIISIAADFIGEKIKELQSQSLYREAA